MNTQLQILAIIAFITVWMKRGQAALAAGIICAICVYCLHKRIK